MKSGGFGHASRCIWALSMALDGGCRIKVQDDVISTEKESFLKSCTWGDLEPLTNNILISLDLPQHLTN